MSEEAHNDDSADSADVRDAGFELREHTADLALYAWGASLESLFIAAADGLYAAIGTLAFSGNGEPDQLDIQANDTTNLLQEFLSELLFRFETRDVALTDLRIDELTDTRLRAATTRRTIDPDRSVLDREVKAVTYHDLEIVDRAGRLEVTVVLDI
jgi:SHS2 domain-containing protein